MAVLAFIVISATAPCAIGQSVTALDGPVLLSQDGSVVLDEGPLVLSAARGEVNPLDEHWTDEFYPLGMVGSHATVPGLMTSGVVNAIAHDRDGALIVAGGLRYASDVQVGYVSRWDGETWDSMGGGVDGAVTALAEAPNGDVYAGGAFTAAGGSPASHVARWDGQTWHPLGNGLNDAVHDLAIGPNGDLYAIGRFTRAGSVDATRIARWDGQQWHSLGTSVSDRAQAIAVASNGDVYVGVFGFVTIGEEGIRRWDGHRWYSLGGGVSGGLQLVRTLTLDDRDNLYAAGSFSSAGGIPAQNIARWNGTSWTSLGGAGLFNFINAVALAPDGSVIVGGNGDVPGVPGTWSLARWDGASWHSIGHGTYLGVKALAYWNDDLIIGGTFQAAGSHSPLIKPIFHLARWDGSSWNALESRPPSRLPGGVSNSGLTHPAGQFYVGGWFYEDGQHFNVGRWTGSGWDRIETPYRGSAQLRGFGPDGSLYVTGAFRLDEDDTPVYVLRWDGVAWHPLSTGLEPWLRAFAIGTDGALYASTYILEQNQYVSTLHTWNGSSWEPMEEGIQGLVQDIAVLPDGSLVIGGTFTQVGGVPANRIARWTGDAWEPIGEGLNGQVNVLALHPNGDLFVTGTFSMAGGEDAVRLARWNGSSWHGLGTTHGDALLGSVLTFDEAGRLYTTSNDRSAGAIMRWDGSQWERLASGANGGVGSLVVAGGSVWVLGIGNSPFTMIAAGKPAGNIARWDGLQVSVETPGQVTAVSLHPAYPNPFSTSTTIPFEVHRAERVEITIHDVLGRRVARLLDAEQSAGSHEVSWRPDGLAAGLYVVRLQVGEVIVQARRVVLLP